MTIPFVGSSRETMYTEIKRLEGLLSAPSSLHDKVNGVEAPPEVCNGVCHNEAKKNLRRPRKNFWEFRKPGSGFGIGGTQITFCPWCGRKLE